MIIRNPRIQRDSPNALGRWCARPRPSDTSCRAILILALALNNYSRSITRRQLQIVKFGKIAVTGVVETVGIRKVRGFKHKARLSRAPNRRAPTFGSFRPVPVRSMIPVQYISSRHPTQLCDCAEFKFKNSALFVESVNFELAQLCFIDHNKCAIACNRGSAQSLEVQNT